MMTPFIMSSRSIEVAQGTSQRSARNTFFKLEEAKLVPVLGVPAGSLAPEQLSKESGL